MGDLPTSTLHIERIEANLERVRGRIERAATETDRNPAQVRLVAVTKGFAPDVIRIGYSLGLRDFGENRVEEAEPKQSALQDLPDLVWHMVGHIQSRKAKRVAPSFGMVHSVDRVKIALSLDRHLEGLARKLPVLLQCNVSGETTKSGWMLPEGADLQSALEDIGRILELPRLEVVGLMTMAPLAPDPELARPSFRRLRQLRKRFQDAFAIPLPELSMGMTDDYEVAVEEGATILRIGRAIFGSRDQVG